MNHSTGQFNSLFQNLPRNNGRFDLILIGRLVVAALLVALALIVEMLPVFRVVLLVLAAMVAGYDIILDAVDAIVDGDYFAAPVVVVLVAFLSVVIGYAWEGALLTILYQIGTTLVCMASERTKYSAQELLAAGNRDFRDRASVLIAEPRAGDTALEKEISSAVSLLLKCVMGLALVVAIVLPLVSSVSIRESIHRALIILTIATPLSILAAMPLSGLIGMGFATRFGALVNNSRVLEKLQQVNTAVIDKSGVFSDDLPKFVGVKSDILDEKTFMEFVAHAVYYSDQPFAKAILAAEDRDFRLDLISDFRDLPGSGVDVKIGGSKVTLARRELLTDRGEAVPYEGREDSNVYYLMVSGKYIGKVLLSDNVNAAGKRLIPDLKQVGVGKCILLTEDSREDSQRIGQTLNADEVYAEFSDETKLQYLESLDRKQTMYLYANSLQTHSNAAVDIRVSKKGKYADALVDPESLDKVPELIKLSNRVRQIAVENAIFAVVVKAILLFLAITGNCTVWFAVFLDFVAALGTILNTIRVTQKPLIELPKL